MLLDRYERSQIIKVNTFMKAYNRFKNWTIGDWQIIAEKGESLQRNLEIHQDELRKFVMEINIDKSKTMIIPMKKEDIESICTGTSLKVSKYNLLVTVIEGSGKTTQ